MRQRARWHDRRTEVGIGFSFTAGPDIRADCAEISGTVQAYKSGRSRDGPRTSYMRGWRGYFGFCETPEVLIALTRWVRLNSGPLFGGSGKHHVVGARLCSHKGFRRMRQAKLPAAAAAPVVSPGAEPSQRGFPMLIQIARSPILVRSVLAQPLEPPCTDPYARWCGRGGVVRRPLSRSLTLSGHAQRRIAVASLCRRPHTVILCRVKW